jgi:hypothetical protein
MSELTQEKPSSDRLSEHTPPADNVSARPQEGRTAEQVWLEEAQIVEVTE